jgi:hypothetical protein
MATKVDPCNLCEAPMLRVKYDVRLRSGPDKGRWGNLCAKCFHMSDAVLGLGSGQRYVRKNSRDPWMQAEGGTQTGKLF